MRALLQSVHVSGKVPELCRMSHGYSVGGRRWLQRVAHVFFAAVVCALCFIFFAPPFERSAEARQLSALGGAPDVDHAARRRKKARQHLNLPLG